MKAYTKWCLGSSKFFYQSRKRGNIGIMRSSTYLSAALTWMSLATLSLGQYQSSKAGQCKAQQNRILCGNSSTLAPSWCNDRNPFIIPRVMDVDHGNKSAVSIEYSCDGDGAGADCAMIDLFVPISTNDYLLRALLVANTANKGRSTVVLLDENFRVETQRIECPYRVEYAHMNPVKVGNKTLVAFGGSSSTTGVPEIDFVILPTVERPFVVASAGHLTFASGSSLIDPHFAWVDDFFVVYTHSATSKIADVVFIPSNATHMLPEQAWVLRVKHAPMTGKNVRVDIVSRAVSCSNKGVEPFKDASCFKKRSMSVSTGTSIMIVDFDAQVAKLGGQRAGLCASCTSSTPDAFIFDENMFGSENGKYYNYSSAILEIDVMSTAFKNMTVFKTPNSGGAEEPVISEVHFLTGGSPPYVMKENSHSSEPALSQQVWLLVSFSTFGSKNFVSSIEMMEIPEYGLGQEVSRGVCSNGQPQYFDATAGRCKPVPRKLFYNSTRSFVKDIVVGFRASPKQLVKLARNSNCSLYDTDCIIQNVKQEEAENILNKASNPNHESNEAFKQLSLKQVDGLHYLEQQVYYIFVSFENVQCPLCAEVGIFEAAEIAEDCLSETSSHVLRNSHNKSGLKIQQVNELSLMGTPVSMEVSSNTHYLFTSIHRKRWELDSMIRRYDMCMSDSDFMTSELKTKLKCSVGDSAFANFAKPRRPAVADFIQISTLCTPGTSCPSLDEETIALTPDGYYTNVGFEKIECEQGYFCRQGTKQPCPIGFHCPSKGLALPTRCDADLTARTNCFREHLVAPQLTQNGTVSITPYMPGLPAPPGYKTQIEPGGQTLQIVACSLGEYCPLGSTAAARKCPEFTFCPNASILFPFQCDIKPAENKKVQYCPTGTQEPHLCPKGFACIVAAKDPTKGITPTNIQVRKVKCPLSTYCPAGSWKSVACPRKYYCPTSSVKKLCPVNSYCPEGSTDPVPCKLMEDCPAGTDKPHPIWPYVALVVFILLTFVAVKIFFKLRDDQRLARAGVREREESVGQYEMQMNPARMSNVIPMLEAHVGDKRAISARLKQAGLTEYDVEDPKLLNQPSSDSSRFSIDFTFEKLGLNVKGTGKPVLQGVTGSIHSGRVTAVMGPSGAGKTTFMTTLAGKAYYGDQKGTILLNGKDEPLSKYKNIVGFVPQEDVMMRDMSVKENLAHSAHLRLSNDSTNIQRRDAVNHAIDILNLYDVRHSLIGDENTRGVSGGQRKRVNIGIEMVADPAVLFLDEPTSGLDSTGSLEVCTALRNIAESGLTVVTVIHQPRYEIFTMFHDVLLLGKGGQTVYLGPSEKALAYFEYQGFKCPNRTNPADFFMDVIAGDVKRNGQRFDPKKLFKMWEVYRGSADFQKMANSSLSETADNAAMVVQPKRTQASFCHMVWLFFHRAIHQTTRHGLDVCIDNIFMLVSALFLGLSFRADGDSWWEPPVSKDNFIGCPDQIKGDVQLLMMATQDKIMPRALMTLLAVGLAGSASSIRILGRERTVYFRECAGLAQPKGSVAYFVAKDLASWPQILVGSLFFTGIFKTVANTRMGYTKLWMVVLPTYYTSYGVGMLVSILVPANLAQLVGFVLVFVSSLYSGTMNKIPTMKNDFPPLNLLYHISFLRYSLEAFYAMEIIYYINIADSMGVDLKSFISSTYDYAIAPHFGTHSYSIMCLWTFVFGIAFRLLTCVAMILKDRDKKM